MPTVFVVDDDAHFRQSLTRLLEAAGLRVAAYADGESFLAAVPEDLPGCVLLDLALPGMNGLAVQQELAQRGRHLPILFFSGHGQIPSALQAVRDGALDFLVKPVAGRRLIEAVRLALAADQDKRRGRQREADLERRLERLSPRERTVMALMADGLSSKEIARRLGLSPRTVEVHRATVLHKTGAANLAELIGLVGRSAA